MRPAERQRQLIWSLATFIILILAAAGAIIAPDEPASTLKNASSANNFAIFHFAGIGLGVFSLLIRTYTYADRRLLAMLSNRRMRTPEALQNPYEQALWRIFRVTGLVQVLGWSLNVLIMLPGLVVVSRSDIAGLYPFLFVAVILQILSFPRFTPLANRVEKLVIQHSPPPADDGTDS